MSHIDDTQLQDYLDGNASADVARIEAHLQTCDFCGSRYRQFRRLYRGLAVDSADFSMSHDFADSVMARLAGEGERRAPNRLWDILTIAGGGVVGLVLLYYFVDMQAIVSGLAGLKVFSFMTPLLEQARGSIGGLNLGLIAFAGILLALISFADQIFVQKRLPFSTTPK